MFDGLDTVIASLDAVLVESNYDPAMLTEGYYPESLKHRIRGAGGHLSNVEAADLLRTSAGTRLQWACLGHLSGDNNSPELALRIHREMLGNRVPVFIAGRHAATDVLEL